MAAPNTQGNDGKRLSFNPQATPFNPGARAFQPAAGRNTPKPRAQQLPQPQTLPEPARVSLFFPTESGLPHIAVPLIPLDIPTTQPVSKTTVVSPQPQRPKKLAKNLEAYPMVQGALAATRQPVRDLQQQVEMDMARRDPAGWAALAKADLLFLQNTYGRDGIPNKVLANHLTKYSQAYLPRGTGEPDMVSPAKAANSHNHAAAQPSPIYAAPNINQEGTFVNLTGMANAHASALSTPGEIQSRTNADSELAGHNTARVQNMSAFYDPRVMGGQSPSFKSSVSTISGGSTTPISQHRQRDVELPRTTPQLPTTFSPGPAFPSLTSLTEPDIPKALRATSQTVPQNVQNDPYMTPAAPHQPRELQYRQGRRVNPYMQTPDTSIPLGNFFPDAEPVQSPTTPRSHRRRGSVSKARKPRWPRVRRTDQGPMPSDADIYPEDASPEQTGRVERSGMEGLSPEVHRHGRGPSHYEFTLGAIPEESEGEVTPQFRSLHNLRGMESTIRASPVESEIEATPQFRLVYFQRGMDGNVRALPVDARSVPDGISDLDRVSPLTSSADIERDYFMENTYSNVAGIAGHLLASQPPQGQLAQDQADGSRYGLKKSGLGLTTCGDTWNPPPARPGTRFAYVKYLWD